MRCFVAAWPDESTRIALAVLLSDYRPRVEHQRATRVDDLHLTLAFIGSLADEPALAVADAVAALSFKSFMWQPDQLGWFRQAGVVWIGSDAASPDAKPLLELAQSTRQVLESAGVAYDRRPLAPHVTLLHGVRHFESVRVAPINWRVDSIALWRSTGSRTGARYARVRP